MTSRIYDLVKSYPQWLDSEIELRSFGEWTEISAPFFDRHNDYLQVYARLEGNTWLITDRGSVIKDLKMTGCDIEGGSGRERHLDGALKGLGVERAEDVIFVRAMDKEFPERLHDVFQAMLAANDLHFTVHQQVETKMDFVDEVGIWLNERTVPFQQNVQYRGSSGLKHRFDFVTNGHSAETPVRVLQSPRRPDRAWAERFIFSWDDTKRSRPDGSQAFAMLNDKTADLNGAWIDALRTYEVEPVMWSQRDAVAVLLR